ncbi:hypothetical protein DFH07DRAFT_766905 [Mycena maculata]|uniref:Uncharacterized protein n=1 Tax=Mycena maculata TaxID=230809 RepID=A0AAD7K371_9AGAR|nr:hypothetical protein DFH07DRAFT_766905 [Mycena maculata]
MKTLLVEAWVVHCHRAEWLVSTVHGIHEEIDQILFLKCLNGVCIGQIGSTLMGQALSGPFGTDTRVSCNGRTLLHGHAPGGKITLKVDREGVGTNADEYKPLQWTGG